MIFLRICSQLSVAHCHYLHEGTGHGGQTMDRVCGSNKVLYVPTGLCFLLESLCV